jgi:hypothetical protein
MSAALDGAIDQRVQRVVISAVQELRSFSRSTGHCSIASGGVLRRLDVRGDDGILTSCEATPSWV